MSQCWSPSPRRGCFRRRRWRTRGLLRQGKAFRDLGPTRLSPSLPSTSVGWDTPRTGSCAGSSMSGAWSCSTSTRLGCCTSPALSPSMRPSSGWSRTWISSGSSSLGEPCQRGTHPESRRSGASRCRVRRAPTPHTPPVTPTGGGIGSGSTSGTRWRCHSRRSPVRPKRQDSWSWGPSSREKKLEIIEAEL